MLNYKFRKMIKNEVRTSLSTVVMEKDGMTEVGVVFIMIGGLVASVAGDVKGAVSTVPFFNGIPLSNHSHNSKIILKFEFLRYACSDK